MFLNALIAFLVGGSICMLCEVLLGIVAFGNGITQNASWGMEARAFSLNRGPDESVQHSPGDFHFWDCARGVFKNRRKKSFQESVKCSFML